MASDLRTPAGTPFLASIWFLTRFFGGSDSTAISEDKSDLSTSILHLDAAKKTLSKLSRKSHGRTRVDGTPTILRRGWRAPGRGSLNGTFCGLLGRIVPQEMSGRIFSGVDQEGNLLVTELKRGILWEDAVNAGPRVRSGI